MTHHIDIRDLQGLSSREAERRIEEEGYNELPQETQRGTFAIVVEVAKEPMFLLLVGAGLIYFLLGDLQEAAMLLFFVFVIIGITVYQERKTENALQALRTMSSPRALVIRDHSRCRIPGREVVRGDLILLSEGDRVPADSCVLESTNLLLDESLLTGESVPVRKFPVVEGKELPLQPGGEDQPVVYSGTLVVQGTGLAEVVATGHHSEIGKIGKTLSSLKEDDTQLEREIKRLVRNIAIVGLVLCGLTVLVYSLTRFDWIEGILAGITLAMAILPEEFPVVLTVFLALGAWRMSRHRVLTRKVTAIEALGAATVLCVDKTGTLTENRMSVSVLNARGTICNLPDLQEPSLPEYCHELVEYAMLASKQDPFDPMEKALLQIGMDGLAGTEHIHQGWELVEEYPLSKDLLAMSNVWRSPDGFEFIIAAKGAPEAVVDLCHCTDEQMRELTDQVQSMAGDGFRVLAAAKASFRSGSLPDGQHDFAFQFLGLIGFLDPIRQGVADALAECRSAGIRVIMITGDYPATAVKISRQIGLDTGRSSLTGQDLERLSDEDLAERLGTTSIVARAVPDQKLRIVRALKRSGNVVAMTGDGVNDAPSLKEADIGIAMGKRGTDVAREASALVLLDDAFSSIVGAIRMGRRIFDNLRKAMAYIIAVHVPIAGMSLLPIVFGWPLVLLPVHIVFLELIIDPACSVVFEAEDADPDIMKKSPRDPRDPLVNRRTLFVAMSQGAVVLAVLLALFFSAYTMGLGADESRAFTFTTIVIANLGLIFVNRSWSTTFVTTLRRPNRALWWVVVGSLFFLGLVLTQGGLRTLFGFAPLGLFDIAVALVAGLASVFWFEIAKIWFFKHDHLAG